MTKSFAWDVTLTGSRMHMRPVERGDRHGLHAAASDPLTWEQHPARTRHQRAVFDPYFDFLLGAGGTLVAVETAPDTIIGCSRYYPVPDHPEDIAIGFTFLARSHWGGSWNREMKRLMVGHALSQCPRVWFHIAPSNQRSRIATARLGARHEMDADLDLGAGPAPYACFTLTRAGWEAATGQALD